MDRTMMECLTAGVLSVLGPVLGVFLIVTDRSVPIGGGLVIAGLIWGMHAVFRYRTARQLEILGAEGSPHEA